MNHIDRRNAMTSAAQVEAARVEGLPAFLYVTADAVATWTGQTLGRIIGFGNAWTSNMGDRRQTLYVKGIDGREYTYTAFRSAGTYARKVGG